MRRFACLLLGALLFGCSIIQAQPFQVEVYDASRRLSDRNVTKIAQDDRGFLWIATFNGLNRFDGYNFVHYSENSLSHPIPNRMILDMWVDQDNLIWLSSLDYIALVDPLHRAPPRSIKINPDTIERRTSWQPHHIVLDRFNTLWLTVSDEEDGRNFLQVIPYRGAPKVLFDLPDFYPNRPLLSYGKHVYVAAYDNELWQMNPDGSIRKKWLLPETSVRPGGKRVIDLQVSHADLWVLLQDGSVFRLDTITQQFQPHPINNLLTGEHQATAFLPAKNGDLWIACQEELFFYQENSGAITDYHPRIKKITDYHPEYRQIFEDRSGVIWIASDYGAIKIVPKENLFRQHLTGGRPDCSTILCSTRGMTEDEKGRIYITYYNSIHRLDPTTSQVRPLFPSRNFFFIPFDLTYHRGKLWTGTGMVIDPVTRRIDSLFTSARSSFGCVLVDRDENLWFGDDSLLYTYRPDEDLLTRLSGPERPYWSSEDGTITFLFQRPASDSIWIGTFDNGLFLLDPATGKRLHWTAATDGREGVELADNQINSIYEDSTGILWLATASGLQRIDPASRRSKIYTVIDGLPDNFINGILPEGDSCLWLSSNNGLSRMSLKSETFINFDEEDGLSHNEFNRMSFFKSKAGTFYFGGLDGVNAFEPGPQFLNRYQTEHQQPKLLITQVSRFDGYRDTSVPVQYAQNQIDPIRLSYRDKSFTFNFALADFREPSQNEFRFFLEGYEQDWSTYTKEHQVRYTNIPAGDYTFRLQAKTENSLWETTELAVPVTIRQAFYKSWWFMALCACALILATYAVMRWRIYRIKKREVELEAIVDQRTRELAQEKEKSEQLLLNILPAETAEELKNHGSAKARLYKTVTVMFTDFKGFTNIAQLMAPEALVAEVDYCFSQFDRIIDQHGLEKIKTIGDAYMCMCIEQPQNGTGNACQRMVQAALDIQDFLARLAEEKKLANIPFFEARIGIHTGPVVAGVVGIKKFAYDIWGDTVNIASRMESLGQPGQVNVSETTYQRIRNHYECIFHGHFTDRNDSDIAMYFVAPKNTTTFRRREIPQGSF